MSTPILDHWVGGRAVRGSTDPAGEVFNPATGDLIAHVPLASAAEMAQAVRTAKAAGALWAETSLSRRAQVLFSFRELLHRHKHDLAETITREHGKVLSDALGEVQRGLEVVEFACGLPHLLKGSFSENVSTNVDTFSLRQPVGVVGVISPFNFPVMVPLWFVPMAVAAGNAVILKPSEKDPSAAIQMAELWSQAGLPDGVVNVVHGGPEAVTALLDDPDVGAVSFVGSTPVAQYVYERASSQHKRVQALGGAKNHMVVLPDADLDLAADAAVSAAYGSAGERCMAISVVVAVEPIADELVKRINERTQQLRVGDGRDDVDMGPLVSQAHRNKVLGYIDQGVSQGADLVADGRLADGDADKLGFFVGPTLFDNVTPAMSIYSEEIFGPVLSLVRVDSYDQAVDLVNANPYGNGTAIFTNDGGAARRFQHEVQVGMIGINVPIPVPMAYYSFGGWKSSLFGSLHAHGTDAINFYTRSKVVTSRWLDPSHAGVDLGFPTSQ